MSTKILNGDSLDVLKTMDDESVNCVITSPPYYGLRDYGTAIWEGGNPNCDHVANARATKKMGNPEFNKNRPSREATHTAGYHEDICPKCGARRVDSQVGLEETPEQYIERLVAIFGEVRRVLTKDGTLWLNIGDSYAGNNSRASHNGRAGFGNPRETVVDVATAFGLEIVPIVLTGDIDDAVEFVKSKPMSTIGTAPMEGLVGRPLVEMQDRVGNRVIVKIKVNDFAKL